MGPAAAALMGSGINAGSSGLGNLWASKERRIQTAWVNRQYDKELANNRQDATTAYERSIDYKAQMDAYRQAGINPIMVAGSNPINVQASSSKASAPDQARGDFSGIASAGNMIAQIPILAQQMRLLQAQTQDSIASANQKESMATGQNLQNELTQKFGFLERSLGVQQGQQTINNMISTQRNLDQSTQLLSAQTGYENVKTLIASIQAFYEDTKQNLTIEGMTWQNRESESRINLNSKKMAEIDAVMQQIQSVIKLNEQAIITGQLTQEELGAKIQNIIADSKLKYEQRITEGQTREAKQRSKTAVEFIDQGLNNVHKAWRGWQR